MSSMKYEDILWWCAKILWCFASESLLWGIECAWSSWRGAGISISDQLIWWKTPPGPCHLRQLVPPRLCRWLLCLALKSLCCFNIRMSSGVRVTPGDTASIFRFLIHGCCQGFSLLRQFLRFLLFDVTAKTSLSPSCDRERMDFSSDLATCRKTWQNHWNQSRNVAAYRLGGGWHAQRGWIYEWEGEDHCCHVHGGSSSVLAWNPKPGQLFD